PMKARSYLPILEAGVQFQGSLRGLNLARDEKAPVVSGGLKAIDPRLIPPGFALGGPDYWERFEKAMGSHASPDQLERYFEAQCLVDDVMAYSVLKDEADLRVLINGSFHSDYFDGAVARIQKRAPQLRAKVIRFIDASEYTEADLSPQLNLATPVIDRQYGALADWIWFAGEPSPTPVGKK
ncbi:MAG: ChaN family lipoprotein, partial [Bdellovibrionales bacterium]|nr:ChaN family lipoprotein [Bdellovibrionales bacterium]